MTTAAMVTEAFRAAFELPDDADVSILKYREHPKWDSVGHMVLVMALEERFDAMLDAQEIVDMSDFAKATEIMAKYAATD